MNKKTTRRGIRPPHSTSDDGVHKPPSLTSAADHRPTIAARERQKTSVSKRRRDGRLLIGDRCRKRSIVVRTIARRPAHCFCVHLVSDGITEVASSMDAGHLETAEHIRVSWQSPFELPSQTTCTVRVENGIGILQPWWSPWPTGDTDQPKAT